MTHPRTLIDRLAAQEAALRQTTFLAPCVAGGSVRTRVEGLVYTFRPDPLDFEGWGVFRPVDAASAVLEREAGLPQIDAYLRLLRPLRLRLVHRLRGSTWLAYPANASDAEQKLGRATPAPVHLVRRPAAFDPVVARTDGAAWWFDRPDRRADPRPADYLREALTAELAPDALRLQGLTPEMRVAYEIAHERTTAGRTRRAHIRAERRLREALALGGGRLRSFRDQGAHWLVEWTTPGGERHTSLITRNDLTVVSAGICLSGGDRAFDLQSLVGVVEQRPEWV